MRLRISTILCLTLFVVTHAAPSRKIESESAKRDDQAPPIEQGQDPYTLMPQDQPPPGNEMLNDCCAPGPTCLNPCQQPPPPPQSFAINFAPPPAPMPPPPPPPPAYTGDCCPPSQTCMNPCPPPQAAQIPPAMPMMQPMPPAMPMAPPVAPPMPPPMLPPMAPPMFGAPMGGPCCDPNVVQQCANPCAPPTSDEGRERRPYQPYPGEITFKLKQSWKDSYLDDNSPASLILKGNVENAIKIALGDDGRSYGYGGYGPVTVSNIYFREGYVPGNPSTMPITVAHVMVNGGSDDASRLQALVTPDSSLGDGLKVYKDSFSAY